MYGQNSHIKSSTTANRPQQPHRTGEAWRKPLQTLPLADKENENPQRSSSAGGMRTPTSCSSSSSFLPMIGGPSLMFSADYSLFPSSQPPVRASSSNRSYAEASRGPKITLADDEDEELLRLGDVSFDNSDAEGGDVSQHPSHAVEGGAEMNVKTEEQKEREKEEKAKYNRMVDELILDFFNKRDIGTTGKCPSWSVLCADIQNEISQKTGTVLPEQWLKSRIGTILVQSGSYVQKKYWETISSYRIEICPAVQERPSVRRMEADGAFFQHQDLSTQPASVYKRGGGHRHQDYVKRGEAQPQARTDSTEGGEKDH